MKTKDTKRLIQYYEKIFKIAVTADILLITKVQVFRKGHKNLTQSSS